MTKYCSRCHRVKRRTAFGHNRTRPDGRQPWCLACIRAYQRQYYAQRHGVRGQARITAAVWPPAPRAG
jgi:hypothetical protein